MRKDTKAAVFWRSFTVLFLFAFAVIAVPGFIIIKVWGTGFSQTAAVCTAAAVGISAPISACFAKRYYGCSLIILFDDQNAAQNRIFKSLDEMGYIKTADSGKNIIYTSVRLKLFRGSAQVEFNEGCAVLRGPEKLLGHIAANFESCYDWSDLYQSK